MGEIEYEILKELARSKKIRNIKKFARSKGFFHTSTVQTVSRLKKSEIIETRKIGRVSEIRLTGFGKDIIKNIISRNFKGFKI